MNKSWGEIGDNVGLDVVVDEEVGAGRGRQGGGEYLAEGKGDEEEVGNRYGTLYFMSDRLNSVQYSTCLNNNIYHNTMSNMSDI